MIGLMNAGIAWLIVDVEAEMPVILSLDKKFRFRAFFIILL